MRLLIAGPLIIWCKLLDVKSIKTNRVGLQAMFTYTVRQKQIYILLNAKNNSTLVFIKFMMYKNALKVSALDGSSFRVVMNVL